MPEFEFTPCCKDMVSDRPRRAIVMTIMPAIVTSKGMLYEGDKCPWCRTLIKFSQTKSEIDRLREENAYLKTMNNALSFDLDNAIDEGAEQRIQKNRKEVES